MSEVIPGRFDNQVALVVGGAQGIGKAIAVRLAREGACLVIADIDRRMLKRAEREIRESGGDVRTACCDVLQKRTVDRTVAETVRRHRRIDVMMYIAGVGKGVPFARMDVKLWDSTLGVNLRGAFLFSRAVVPHMIKQHSGKLVFMCSTNACDAEA